MSYRMYLTASAAPISPTANSGWESTAGITRGLLSTTKAGANAALAVAETSTSNVFDVALGQWVSAPFTHAGTVDLRAHQITVARLESDAAADLTTRYAVRVVSNDGSTLRGETVPTQANEWPTTSTALEINATGSSVVEVACQVGDRLVVEYGYKATNSVATSFTGTIRHGGTAGDLTDGNTANVTTHSPWIQFDGQGVADLFSTAGADVWQNTVDATLAVEAAFGADLSDTDGGDWTWTDLTADVRYSSGIELTHGRGDEASDAQPASCRFTLDNRAGDYSLGPQASNYPYVRRGTPIRVRVDLGVGWHTLFQGGADTWSPSWAGGPNGDAVVALSASGALRRLAQGQAPVDSVFRSFLSGLSSLVAYWPMEDGPGADLAASAIPDTSPMTYAITTPTFGTTVTEFPCASSLVTLDGARMVAPVPSYTDTNEQSIRFLAKWPSSGIPDGAVVLRAYCPGGTLQLWDLVYVTGASAFGNGKLNLHIYDSSGSEVDASGNITFGQDGDATLVVIEMTQSGADVVWNVVLRQPGLIVALEFGDTTTGNTVGNVSYIEFNPNGDIDGLAVGHLHVLNDILDTGASVAEFDAFRFEHADDRIDRLADENGEIITVTGTSDVRMGPQYPDTLLALLRQVEATDQGILYDGVGPGLSYICRTSRESQAVDLTLDASTGQAFGLDPIDDDQRTRNLVQATRVQGGSAVYEDTSGAAGTSVIGIYDDSITVNPGGDTALSDYASWLVHSGTIVGYRYPQLGLALHHDPTLAAGWLAVTPGARVDVTNIEDVRTQHPAGTISLAVEGYTQRLTQFTWDVELVCSPYEVWQVGQYAATSGDTNEHVLRAEGDGSTLASAASAGATSLSVATASGPLWTTDSDDLPMTIEVEGTPITVTAISGGSSPQTFTVTGSTVVRALSSGAAVTLHQPRVLGLER